VFGKSSIFIIFKMLSPLRLVPFFNRFFNIKRPDVNFYQVSALRETVFPFPMKQNMSLFGIPGWFPVAKRAKGL